MPGFQAGEEIAGDFKQRRDAPRSVVEIQAEMYGPDLDTETTGAADDLAMGHAATDQPAAALLADLAGRGLLDETLVIWGGEFGRTSDSQGSVGRDHNPKGFTIWMAGGGIKGGVHHGATDEFGYKAVEDKVHVNDLHATLLDLDHEKLTYRHNGRDYRLTDLGGRVISEILA